MNFDPKRAYEHVRNLSFPRMVGSPGETRAREYIDGSFRSLGLEVEIQPFRFSKLPWEAALRIFLLFQSALLIAAARLFPYHPYLSAGISLIILGGNSFLTRWGGAFEAFDSNGKKESANIIARPVRSASTPSSPWGAGSGRATVVFMAHYDSKSQLFPLPLRFGLFALGFLLLGGLSLAILILALTPLRPPLLPIAVVSVIPQILLQFNVTTNASDGALDNASGAGVLLELARVFSLFPPDDLHLIFLATGAEELGLVGAIRFIKKYGPSLDPKSTYFVNLDGPGAKGKVIYVTAFGIPAVRSCRRLRALAESILRERGVAGRDSTLFIGAAMDSIPMAARGYEAVSIASGSISRAVLSVHSKHDTIENIDPEALGRCGELARTIALRISA